MLAINALVVIFEESSAGYQLPTKISRIVRISGDSVTRIALKDRLQKWRGLKFVGKPLLGRYPAVTLQVVRLPSFHWVHGRRRPAASAGCFARH